MGFIVEKQFVISSKLIFLTESLLTDILSVLICYRNVYVFGQCFVRGFWSVFWQRFLASVLAEVLASVLAEVFGLCFGRGFWPVFWQRFLACVLAEVFGQCFGRGFWQCPSTPIPWDPLPSNLLNCTCSF